MSAATPPSALEVGGDRAEGIAKIGPDRPNDGDGHDDDQRGDERVFDRRNATVILISRDMAVPLAPLSTTLLSNIVRQPMLISVNRL